LYLWRKRYNKLEAADVKKFRALQHENARLKKLLAERDRAIEVTREINAKNGERARTPTAGQIRASARPVESKRVRAAGQSLLVQPIYCDHCETTC